MMKLATSLAQPKVRGEGRGEGDKGEDSLPQVSLGMVDVRDVAEAHVRALERRETDGERILVTQVPSAWLDYFRVVDRA